MAKKAKSRSPKTIKQTTKRGRPKSKIQKDIKIKDNETCLVFESNSNFRLYLRKDHDPQNLQQNERIAFLVTNVLKDKVLANKLVELVRENVNNRGNIDAK